MSKPGVTTKICIPAPLLVSNEMRQVGSTKGQGGNGQKYRG